MSEHIWGTRLEKPALDDRTISHMRAALALTEDYQLYPEDEQLARLAKEARRKANYEPPEGLYFSQKLGGIASLTVIEFGAPNGRHPVGEARPKHIQLTHTRHSRVVGNRLRFTHQLPAPEDPNTIGLDLVNLGGTPCQNLVQLDIGIENLEFLEFIDRLPANMFDVAPYDMVFRASGN